MFNNSVLCSFHYLSDNIVLSKYISNVVSETSNNVKRKGQTLEARTLGWGVLVPIGALICLRFTVLCCVVLFKWRTWDELLHCSWAVKNV
jgi:hypothetical protein